LRKQDLCSVINYFGLKIFLSKPCTQSELASLMWIGCHGRPSIFFRERKLARHNPEDDALGQGQAC
jgi:hypothetical protein